MKKENSKPSRGNSADRSKKPASKTDFSSRPKKKPEDSDKTESIEGMRLNKYIAYCGVCSRRQAADLVKSGAVTVNGKEMLEPFYQMKANDLVSVKGKPVKPESRKVYILMNKPKNVITTAKDERGRKTVMDLLAGKVHERVFPVGRLDRDTTGLLLITDDGQLNHQLSSAKRKVPKVYLATTKHPLDQGQIDQLLAGVLLADEPESIAAAAAEIVGEHQLRLTLTEGKYHQVKRMVAAVSNRVEALHREAVGELTLPPDLKPGEWRWLTASDLQKLGYSK